MAAVPPPKPAAPFATPPRLYACWLSTITPTQLRCLPPHFHHHLVKPVDLQAVDEVLTGIATENIGVEEA
jgi:hypothetical protein